MPGVVFLLTACHTGKEDHFSGYSRTWLVHILRVLYTASYVDTEIREEHSMESTEANTTATPESKARAIVCLYSQEDEPFYTQLKKSLNLCERGGQVRWLEVFPGDELAA